MQPPGSCGKMDEEPPVTINRSCNCTQNWNEFLIFIPDRYLINIRKFRISQSENFPHICSKKQL